MQLAVDACILSQLNRSHGRDPTGSAPVAIGGTCPGLNPDKLLAEAEAFLDSVQAAEGIGRKLCRSLVGFIESEVVPPATRAADQGIDPTPIMETVADLLRLFADSLDRPDLDGSTDQQLGSDGPT